LRASKRSQVLAPYLAPHARLNHRQPHGRAARSAWRTLVLFVEHMLLPEVGPQFGALSSPASQPTAFDLRGSDAITLNSTWSHLGHSNSRCSKPVGPAETRSSIIRVWQREQRGRSIAVRNCWREVMALLRRGGSVTELSVTDGSQYGTVMKETCSPKLWESDQYGSHSENLIMALVSRFRSSYHLAAPRLRTSGPSH
jgi:hypothetical protein